LAHETPPDLSDRSVSGLRFAVPNTGVLEGLDTHVAAHFERSLSRLSAAGAYIEHVDMPELMQPAQINAQGGFSAAESYAWHRALLESRADEYDPRVRVRIQQGANMSAADYIDLFAARKSLITAVETRSARFDALLMPTTAIVPPRMAELESDAEFARTNSLVLRNTLIINMFDGCAISIPNHADGEPPTGLMLACRGGLDAQLFRCAAAAESVVRP
jgi:aspartyl-tRNA(Asn)/glutamyl-tRNA(Gln) amidotransferase subunit A